MNYLKIFEEWQNWQVSKQGDKDRPQLPESIRPLLHECIFNNYRFTEEQADTLMSYSNVMLYSHKPFTDFVTILAYCGVKGSPNMETSIDIDPYILRETKSHPCEIAARCLGESGVFKKEEVPLYYDYGVLGFQVPDSFRGIFLILTNYRAFAVGGIVNKREHFYKLVYEHIESFLRSLDYIFIDKRLTKIQNQKTLIRAESYTKFFMTHKEKYSIPLFIPLPGTIKIKSLKMSEEGYREDWLPVFFSPIDLQSDIDSLKKNFDETRKKFPQSDILTKYPYSKKSIDKDDLKRRTEALHDKILGIHEPIKDTTVAWHVDS